MIERAAGRLRVTAPMVIANATALLAAGRAVLSEATEVIDLEGVPEADSSALSVMLGWLRSAQSQGRQIQFVNLPGAIRVLADLYGVDEILPVN